MKFCAPIFPMGTKGGIKEGLAKIQMPAGVFFNPHMQLCRDIFSLSIGALPEKKLSLCDCFAASGARGIRYKLENKNISKLSLVDWSLPAADACKKNIALNKLKNSRAYKSRMETFLAKRPSDFLEIDPFGTPAPYLHPAFASFSNAYSKSAYLSATATDTAVLCGAHSDACYKIYQCSPLNCEFCHENAIRILISKIARTAADFEYGISPLFSFSHRHYVKVLLRVQKGAAFAVSSIKTLGYVSYCPKCLYREWAKFPTKKTCACGTILLHSGPMWLGPLWEKGHVQKMLQLLPARPYLQQAQLQKILCTVESELSLPPFYYDAHALCKKLKIGAHSLEALQNSLAQKGFCFSRTHFLPTGFRTDAPLEEIKKALL